MQGIQKQRRGRWSQRLWGAGFYFLVRTILHIECTPNVVTARLMTRRYVDAVLSCPERDFDLSLLGHAVGFRRETLAVTKELRDGTRYSAGRHLRLVESYVTAGTTAPLHWLFALGGAFGLAALALAVRAAVREPALPTDWVLAAVFFVGGGVVAAVALVGLYTAKIFQQVKGRPTAVVRKVWGGGGGSGVRKSAS
jgi:putative glycosyltransferase